MSGTVLEVNPAVVDNPALVNTTPDSEGWLCKIKLSNAAELDGLLSPEQYKAQIGGYGGRHEIHR